MENLEQHRHMSIKTILQIIAQIGYKFKVQKTILFGLGNFLHATTFG